MQMHDGMHGVIVERGKNYMYIATRDCKFIDLFTLGYFPKPNYEQIGQYHGNTEGFEEGDTVEVYFKNEKNNLKRTLKIMLLSYGNISTVRKIKSGKKLSRIQQILGFFSFKA